eukprot:TRINITY_DN940_c0_g1_i3.p1 TRINITY_DN940_c0_g1~~TRINITY_DN940_c0_g1_i3.p1  ORF type:complete len:163 (+),score=28.15 TRINITY_DN940_c0_g1_i3:43-531(+)
MHPHFPNLRADRPLVFVYGTLKKGFYNHENVMKKRAECYEYIGDATTSEKYPLLLDVYAVPYLVRKSGMGHCISGELYQVTDEGLQALDELEGVPGRYCRELISVTPKGSTETLSAHLYQIKNVPNLEARQLYSEYTLELHKAYKSKTERDESLRKDWGGYE